MAGLLNVGGLANRRPSTLALARAGAMRVWRDGRGAVVAVWAIVAAVSGFAIVPPLVWWTRELGRSIEAGRLIDATNLGVILELTHDNPAGPRTMAERATVFCSSITRSAVSVARTT